MNNKRILGLKAGLVWLAACAQGTSLGQSSSATGSEGAGGASASSSSSGGGGNGSSGTGGIAGAGGMDAGGGGNGGSAGSMSSSSSASSSSSSSSSSGGACSGVIVDWNWNMGTGPTNLTYKGINWSVGTATDGPNDGLKYLATVPESNYGDNANDWVQLPAIDLAPYQNCQFRTTVDLWRNSEKVGNVYYDGGNLQYTTNPTGASGWMVLDGGGMQYDGVIVGCIAGCIVMGQPTWSSSTDPKAKTAKYEGPMPGTSITFRFTFYSDDAGRFPGLYIKRLLVEAF